MFSAVSTAEGAIFNIYVRNCNKKTVEAVKRWVNNSVIAQGEPLKDGRCNIVTK